MSLNSLHANPNDTNASTRTRSRFATGLVGSVLALAGAVGVDAMHDSAAAAPTLAAEPADPLQDSDGDLLPDRLERVLLTDPDVADTDHDGITDFIAAVQFRRPLDPPGEVRPLDDAMRVAISSGVNAQGRSIIWVHFLFRFVGANLGELRSIDPYLDYWGTRLPLSSLLGVGRTGIATGWDPNEGLMCVASFELGAESALRTVMPCTIGATAVVGSRVFNSGAFLQEVDGISTVLTAADDDKGFVMPLDPAQNEDPFWSSSRVCVMQLEVMSASPAGALCEVRNAECMSSGRLACPPTCISSRGRSMFFPNGISTVTGSNR